MTSNSGSMSDKQLLEPEPDNVNMPAVGPGARGAADATVTLLA